MEPIYNLFSRFLALRNMRNDSIRERLLRRRNETTSIVTFSLERGGGGGGALFYSHFFSQVCKCVSAYSRTGSFSSPSAIKRCIASES